MLPVEASLDAFAGHEHRRCRAVVRSETSVLLDPPPKFSEHHHRHIVGAPDALDVFQESVHSVGRVHQQPAVQVRLLHVGVERVAGIGDVIEARRHPGGNQRRDSLKVAAKPAANAVIHGRSIRRRRLAHEV